LIATQEAKLNTRTFYQVVYCKLVQQFFREAFAAVLLISFYSIDITIVRVIVFKIDVEN
jgi:hypothetical protein